MTELSLNNAVKTTFGEGKIIELRSDGIVVVLLDNWKLATGKSPTLYLNSESVKKIESKPEDKGISFNYLYEKALQVKDAAKELYISEKYFEAIIKYGECMEIMKGVTQELSNEEKTSFFEIFVTCSSNQVLCYWGLNDYAQSVIQGKNTINIVEAIEIKIKSNDIILAPNSTLTFDKLKDIKVKNLRVVTKSEIKKKSYQDAKGHAELALSLTTNDKVIKEFKDMIVEINKCLSAEKKKEKAMWQKALTAGSEGETSPNSNKSPKKSTNLVKSSSSQSISTWLWNWSPFFLLSLGSLGALGFYFSKFIKRDFR